MQSKEKGNIIFIRLFPGEEIFEELKKVCQKHKIKTAVIISGLGQLREVSLGFFKRKGNYLPTIFKKAHELLTLSGNICREKGEYFFHLHAILSDEKKRAFGGHLLKGRVSITGEIVLLKTNLKIKRRPNKLTGLKDLFLD